MIEMRRALILIPISALGVAVGVYTLDVVRHDPASSFAGASAGGAVALLAAGWALIGSGLTFWARRPANRVGPLIVAAGFAWFLLEWINPEIGSALAFTIGLCLYASCPPLVGHAVLAYPGGRVGRRPDQAAIAVAYAGGVLVLGVVPAIFSSPSAHGCNECPRNLVVVADATDAAEIRRVGVYLGLGWALALGLLILVRLVRATAASRRASWMLDAAAVAYFVFVAAVFAASLDRGLLWNGTFERRLWLAQAAALVGIASGVAWQWARSRRARSTVAQLVVELAQAPPPGGLRDVLAAIVGDPDLVVAYPIGESGRLVDVQGRTIDVARRPAQTSLMRDGRPVAVLAHAPGLLDDEQLVEEVTAAARLALENERLQAEVRARLAELRASRARIVAAGDAERKRLERDLHDGAQQRLVALALSLRLLRSQVTDEEASSRMDEAEAELGEAISDLRELAYGIFPAVLADGGFAVAVHALAEGGGAPIKIRSLPARRLPPEMEIAAYAVVAEAARTAKKGIVVDADARNGAFVLDVGMRDADGLDVAALEDRVGSLDGRLDVVRGDNGRVTIRAEFPCES
jgi:signal transduction histidine kinase